MTHVPNNVLQGWEVVVVDDDPPSLAVARTILVYYGADVTTAVDGEDGWMAIDAVRPRFVISDISMPRLDGWGLIDRLQRTDHLRDIPVIALTAHAMNGDRAKAMAAGFYNYLTKPLTANTFIEDLLRLLLDHPVFEAELELGDWRP